MARKPPIHLWSVEADLRSLSGGSRNAVLRTVGLVQDLVFKSTERSEAALAWLERPHAAAKAAGVVVPEMLSSTRGNLNENGWTAERLIDGLPISAERLPALLPKIRDLHRLAKDVPQRPGFLASRDLIGCDTGGDIDLTVMPPDLVQTCRAAFEALDDDAETLVHGDLSPPNVLECADGRIALIDWDEARRDLPIFDTGQLTRTNATEKRALLAWEIACCWQKEPDRARALSALL